MMETCASISALPVDILYKIATYLEGIDLLSFLNLDGVANALREYHLPRPVIKLHDTTMEYIETVAQMSLITPILLDIRINGKIQNISRINGDVAAIDVYYADIDRCKYTQGYLCRMLDKLRGAKIYLEACDLTSDQFHALTSINENSIKMMNCHVYGAIAAVRSSVKRLSLCYTYQAIFDISNFRDLETLELEHTGVKCNAVLPVTKLTLNQIDVVRYDNIMPYLPNINDVSLICATSALNRNMPYLSNVTSLTISATTNGLSINMETLGNLVNLTQLKIKFDQRLLNADRFDLLTRLTVLDITYLCNELIRLPDFRVTNPLLQKITLHEFIEIDCAYLTGDCVEYIVLYIEKARNANALANGKSLKYLELIDVKGLQLDVLNKCGKLEELNMEHCCTAYSVDEPIDIPNLRILNIKYSVLPDNCIIQCRRLEYLCISMIIIINMNRDDSYYSNVGGTKMISLDFGVLGDMPCLSKLDITAANDDFDVDLSKYTKLSKIYFTGTIDFVKFCDSKAFKSSNRWVITRTTDRQFTALIV